MENLSERFNVLQDQLMNIYEAAEQTLEAQIAHWLLLRKEAVLLYFARQKGITRIGYQPVPPLAVSEAKAKQAIGIMLQLQSLQKSEFADEPWTLVDTSIETYKNAPENHFKKGATPVEVIYDKQPDNANVYTMWKHIYYTDADDKWHKTTSGVNQTGIYYMQGSFRHYYVVFADDARRYSATGEWEVKINKDTVFAPVTSSTPPGSPPGQADTDTAAKTPTTSADSTSRQQRSPAKQPQQTETKGRRYGRRPSSRTRPQKEQRRSRSRHRTRSRSRSLSRVRAVGSTTVSRSRSSSLTKAVRPRSRSRSRGRATATSRRRAGRGSPRRRRSTSRSPSTNTFKRSQRGGGRRGRGRGSRGRRDRSSSTSPTPTKRSRGESSRLRGVSPSEVGRSVQSVSAKHTGRLGRLLDEAIDPPVILVRGDANTLKCFRNRARVRYTGLFKYFSTTWSWVAGDSTERLGRSRMLILFTSAGQRKDFDETVKYPKGVDRSYGNLDSL